MPVSSDSAREVVSAAAATLPSQHPSNPVHAAVPSLPAAATPPPAAAVQVLPVPTPTRGRSNAIHGGVPPRLPKSISR